MSLCLSITFWPDLEGSPLYVILGNRFVEEVSRRANKLSLRWGLKAEIPVLKRLGRRFTPVPSRIVKGGCHLSFYIDCFDGFIWVIQEETTSIVNLQTWSIVSPLGYPSAYWSLGDFLPRREEYVVVNVEKSAEFVEFLYLPFQGECWKFGKFLWQRPLSFVLLRAKPVNV